MASKYIYRTFLSGGVKIFEMNQALHAKTVTIDGIYSSIGSFNLDPWSHFYNKELNLTTVDPEIASKLEEQFNKDLEKSTEVTTANLDKISHFQRCLHAVMYFFFRLF